MHAGIVAVKRRDETRHLWMNRGRCPCQLFFFFNDTATTEIYTLSLHDALPIFLDVPRQPGDLGRDGRLGASDPRVAEIERLRLDRKSTRLNSSHGYISYAVFCLKKKNLAHRQGHTPRERAADSLPVSRPRACVL